MPSGSALLTKKKCPQDLTCDNSKYAIDHPGTVSDQGRFLLGKMASDAELFPYAVVFMTFFLKRTLS